MELSRISTIGFAVAAALALQAFSGCHEEPTIVIRFEPSDADVRAAARPTPTPTPTPTFIGGAPVQVKRASECKVAADCVAVPDDCCECANGGKLRAIPKSKAAAAKAERVAHCKHIMCPMMVSNDPTCGMRADCVAAECVMAKKK